MLYILEVYFCVLLNSNSIIGKIIYIYIYMFKINEKKQKVHQRSPTIMLIIFLFYNLNLCPLNDLVRNKTQKWSIINSLMDSK